MYGWRVLDCIVAHGPPGIQSAKGFNWNMSDAAHRGYGSSANKCS